MMAAVGSPGGLGALAGALLSWRLLERTLPARVVGYVAAAVGVALTSLGIGAATAYFRIGGLIMLHLLVVLPTAVRFGRGPAIFACVAASLTYDWFFTNPIHTFTMVDPEEWIALLLFLVVAIVASQLALAERERADEAQRREHEAAALHAVSRGLSATDDLDAALQATVEQLSHELGLTGCAVLTPAPGGTLGDPLATRRTVVRAAFGPAPELAASSWLARTPVPVVDQQHGRTHRWIRLRRPERRSSKGPRSGLEYVPLTAGDQTVGMLRLVSAAGPPRRTVEAERLLGAAADLLARAIERARLRQAATDAVVLRQTDEVRQAILQAVSHDLRTPLASIKAAAESLLQPDIPWTEEQRRAYLVAIRQQADRLHQLVEDLIDLSRIEAGKLVPERGWYPLDVLVDDVLARLDAVVVDHPVTVDVPEDLPPVPLDPAQIGQVLVNLIENAARYTSPGTPIAIAAHREGQVVHISVSDTGPGIPPESIPHVFDKFYRVSGGDRAAVPGTGLGLAVARGFVEAHGGTIAVQSPPPDGPRGTCFSFTLPLTTPGLVAPSRDPQGEPTRGAPAGGDAAASREVVAR